MARKIWSFGTFAASAALLVLGLLPGCSQSAHMAGSGEPAWFPDGHHLLYLAGPADHTNIIEYDLNDGRTREIQVQVDGRPYSPTLSPDGSQIAFAVSSDPKTHASDIYVASSDGGNARKIYGDGYNNSHPVFTRTGNELIFVEARAFKNYSPIAQPHLHDIDLMAADLKTGRVHALTQDRAYEVLSPIVDPVDGSVVATVPGPPDPKWNCPLPVLTRFTLDDESLTDPRELHPDLSAFLETDPWTVEWRNYYPWKDIGSVAFDSRGRLYFLWPTTDPETHFYDYETYRWDPMTKHTERLTTLRKFVVEMRPSPDGKWLALEIGTAVGVHWGAPPPPHVFLYSIDSKELRALPEPL